MVHFRKIIQFFHSARFGFTVIEMLIALSIIGVLSTLVVINLSQLQGSSAVTNTAEELATSLRQAQLWALTGQTRGGVRPEGGWGVHTEQCSAGSCSYVIFADTFPSGAPNRQYDVGNDDTVVTGVIPDTVTVTSVVPSSSGGLDIVFDIPVGGVYLNGFQTVSEGIIMLSHDSTGTNRVLRINQATGRIHLDE